MRTTFVKTLLAIAKRDPRIMLLTGDLGFTVFEEFRDTLGRQYLNAGVAEQNMVGVAAGLALSGRRVFVYSIVPFVTFRCFEHIRNDVCYHNLPVCIVGVGGGYSYGHMGSTHHALEDIAVMRSLPNMKVLCPGDPLETEALVHAIVEQDGPCYLRLGKAGEPTLHMEPLSLTIGRAIEMRSGQDLTLIASGTMLERALEIADRLQGGFVRASVLSMHTVKPLDVEAVRKAAAATPLLVTLEEHSRIGGLGSAVAEALSLEGLAVRHLLCAAPDGFATYAGSQEYLRACAGLTVPSICKRIEEVCRVPA
ncbi:hypothetical protein A3H22_00195 [Candidatus Peribacteria bacterium RIFCSPLOWO2_12_FULL_55_15]|nr:MAG: hypothetical protein A2789_01260 [Candidatus Peribacteria bacterium RIFCSPHIGHO2_01_FULL_54_22]OGJ63115.1 MAG: hypothetical protein A3D12_02745 [Candidatus Peribacteria bacterium RIFCSPHIGHO2_02_FULL_55_24]OGJ70177.1 MAG: hypothetical protein A3H90_00535 [Candidatus Peribacteria bacterium RIFCSPLOWO2_02_FULL_55_36]OGJ71679.1 MAG: hypothetical protein A3H22_00195 [Candidatus Peribacteria bacterium RIFCSPLOWO2_12_FULL_55_15]